MPISFYFFWVLNLFANNLTFSFFGNKLAFLYGFSFFRNKHIHTKEKGMGLGQMDTHHSYYTHPNETFQFSISKKPKFKKSLQSQKFTYKDKLTIVDN